jgi:hypothetical protein
MTGHSGDNGRKHKLQNFVSGLTLDTNNPLTLVFSKEFLKSAKGI